MPRSIINLIGIVVTIGVLLLAFFLVALPVAFQALGVVGQTSTVASTNSLYQAQVDHLREQEARLDEIQTSVAGLQTQITPANELDDVFELVGKAAEASGVSIVSVTAGQEAAFVARTSPTRLDQVAAPAPETAAPTDATATPAPNDGTATDSGTAAPTTTASPADGRTQVDFSINVTAGDLPEIVAFLDALRTGPRLLGQIQSTVAPTEAGFDLKLTALTFVLPQEG